MLTVYFGLPRFDTVRFQSYDGHMTAAAAKLVDESSKLPPPEQREALDEILKSAGKLDYGPLSHDDLTSIAAQSFALLDREEDDAATR